MLILDEEDNPEGHEEGAVAFGNRSEAVLNRWGHFIVRNRWWGAVLPILFTGFLVSFLPQLTIDNSTESFLREDDPVNARYREFRERYDRDDRIIIAIQPPDVFDLSFLEQLRRLHLELERELPYVQDVTSLFNARATYGVEDELIVEGLLEGWLDEWPSDTSRVHGLRERVLANPLYSDALVSRDAKLTTITIKPFTFSAATGEDALSGFDEDGAVDSSGKAPALTGKAPLLTGRENDELVAAIYRVVDPFRGPDFRIYLAGPLIVTDHINRALVDDMGPFMAVSTLVILLLLFVLFRRLSGAVLPVVVVLMSVSASVGLMVAIGLPATTAVQILPVFLLAVGICDAVHILAITYQQMAKGRSKDDSIAYAVGHSGLAVIMTSLTTAAGMASFASAEMAPVAQLGIIAPIAVMIALAYTLVMLPAVLAIARFAPPRAPRSSARPRIGDVLTGVLVRVGGLCADHPRQVLGAAGVFVAVCLMGAAQVRVSHMALAWFDPDDALRLASELLDRELRGTMSLELILDTGRENGLHDPDVQRRIEAAMRHAETLSDGAIFVGKAISIVDITKETHQALNENRPEYHVIPDDRQLIAQELLLFENGGADALEELVDTQFRYARMSLRAPFVDAILYGPFMEKIERELRPILGDDIQIEMTGMMPVLARVVSAVIVSMARSYGLALLVITPLMILLLRNVRLGLLSMIPNLIPIVFVLGVMGWVGIALDTSMIMIGAMIIGLAVDDTIHFMHKFRVYFSQSGNVRGAICETLQSTGAALMFTTLVLSGGFMTFTLATMVNTRNFGLLAALATIVAFLADVIVGPALMAVFAERTSIAAQGQRLPSGVVPGSNNV